MKKLPTIAFPQFQAIAAPPEDEDEDEDLDTSGLYIGEIAEEYLRKFASKQEVDKTFASIIKTGNSTSEIVLSISRVIILQ